MSSIPPPSRNRSARPRVVALLTLRRPLRVTVCALCAVLVAAGGADQHTRHHAAQVRR